MFETATYTGRRKRLHSQIDSGLLLFLGNDESPMNYADNPFHYRQDSTFLYFFGLNFAGLVGVIDIDAGKDILFGNDLTVEDIVWMGTQPSLAERSQKVGIQYVQPLEGLKAYLTEAEQKGRRIHFLPPYRAEHTMKLNEYLGTIPSEVVQSASIEFITAVVEQRKTKSEEEIKEIERAVDITADMHITAIKMARPGITEARIAAAVHEVALAAGGGGLGIPDHRHYPWGNPSQPLSRQCTQERRHVPSRCRGRNSDGIRRRSLQHHARRFPIHR